MAASVSEWFLDPVAAEARARPRAISKLKFQELHSDPVSSSVTKLAHNPQMNVVYASRR